MGFRTCINKWCLFFLFVGVMPATLFAGSDAYIINQQRIVTIMPTFQRWSLDNNARTEISFPVFFYLPLSRTLNVSFVGNGAAVSSDNTSDLNGIADTQFNLNYYLDKYRLLLTLNANLPSGDEKLTDDELVTSTFLSQQIFNFRLPVFGQGFNFTPGFTWAVPVQENLAFGIGASRQFKGEYSPLAGTDYTPGNEWLFTTGVDWRVNSTATLAADFIFTLYDNDEVDNTKIFDAGNKFVASLQYRQSFNYNQLWLFARYRSRAKSNFLNSLGDNIQPIENPDQIAVKGHYRWRLNDRYAMKGLIEGRFYEDTKNNNDGEVDFDGINLFGFGMAPEFRASRAVTLLAQVKYFFGSFENGTDVDGIEAGLGATFVF